MGHGRCVEEIRHLAARMHSYPTSSLTVFAPVTTVPGMRLGLQWGPGRVLDGPRKDGQRGGGRKTKSDERRQDLLLLCGHRLWPERRRMAVSATRLLGDWREMTRCPSIRASANIKRGVDRPVCEPSDQKGRR